MKVAIVGGGTMGLAAAWALARRGCAVELFERFGHVHAQGSHGGHTRIIRHAYHEGSDYVELVSRADREWTALAERTQSSLLIRCGLLEFGPGDQPEFKAARAALGEHGIRHELLDATPASERFGFRIPREWTACFSPDSGYLRVAACLDALRREAEDAGARLHYGVRVRELALGGERARILFEDGRVFAADRVVVSPGAWAPTLLKTAFGARLSVLRKVLAWTRAAEPERAILRTLPAWAAFVPEGFFYGFPDNDEGISGFKLACHSSAEPDELETKLPVDPETVDRSVHEHDLAPLRRFIERYRPDAGSIVASSVCLYTNTPSGDFWIDHHPDDDRYVIAAGFSGHGFKFAPVIGLGIAELLCDGHSPLALPRFGRRANGVQPML
ncbi:MAG: N-methyl-L-tryptophan oxidase [Enhygromyxa sp.]